MRRLAIWPMLTTALIATRITTFTQTASVDPPPSILISRQLAEALSLDVGGIVRLSRDPSRTNARPFRIAGVYEPTPDPMRFAQRRLEVRLHLPDMLTLTADASDPAAGEAITSINIALEDAADARAFVRDVTARLPTLTARSTDAVDERTTTFIVIERFHLAIAIVTVVGSAVFLLALMVMVVDERRGTVGTLRLIGFTRRRILIQVLAEGALIATVGAVCNAGAVQPLLSMAVRHDADLSQGHADGGVAVDGDRRAARHCRQRHRLVDAASPTSSRVGGPLVLRAFRLAWLCLVRQPVRAVLGICGIAAIGALLFDMLLLSRGLVLSFADLLERSGFDVRVLASDAPPLTGPRLTRATALASELAGLPGIEAVLQLRVRDAEVVSDSDAVGPVIDFIGADPRVRSMWTMTEGGDLPDTTGSTSVLVVNRQLAARLRLGIGSTISLRGRCSETFGAPPPVRFTIVGIAHFPFDSVTAATVAGTLADVNRLCADDVQDRAEMLLVRSMPDVGALGAAGAIRAAHPELRVVTNEELVERFSRVEFSYFRQISTVLATVTLFFGFLLIAVLLTVSVNQRLAEIAALRAVGLSRARVTAGVLWESILLVGAGGTLAVPLGLALSMWLDAILRMLPGIPADLRFFVFEPRALVFYLALLVTASIAAAAYPMRIVSTLPIAATLRREAIS
jgi:putative ABC transport system permease protein